MTSQSAPSELIARAAMETFENLAFTELAPDPEAASDAGNGLLRTSDMPPQCHGSIVLQEDRRLGVSIDRDFLLDVTRVLFNEPGEIAEPMLGDALKEILNIVAGRFLGGLLGDGDFRLGLPELLTQPAPDWTRAPVRCRMRREEGGGLSLYLSAA